MDWAELLPAEGWQRSHCLAAGGGTGGPPAAHHRQRQHARLALPPGGGAVACTGVWLMAAGFPRTCTHAVVVQLQAAKRSMQRCRPRKLGTNVNLSLFHTCGPPATPRFSHNIHSHYPLLVPIPCKGLAQFQGLGGLLRLSLLNPSSKQSVL